MQDRRSKKHSPQSSRGAGKAQPTEATVRIGAGQWRSRVLRFPEIEGLRPTGSRIRETLFNWLTSDIAGSHCLDAFSGSGVLGFESLSRGAASAVMLEPETSAYRALIANAESLEAQGANIFCHRAQDFLAKNTHRCAFDIVFIDPPFALNLWSPVVSLLEGQGWLSEQALIYIETPKQYTLDGIPASWQLEKSKQAGNVNYALYRRMTLD